MAHYEPPTLTKVGSFKDVTRYLFDGICDDFIGAGGYAVICIW